MDADLVQQAHERAADLTHRADLFDPSSTHLFLDPLWQPLVVDTWQWFVNFWPAVADAVETLTTRIAVLDGSACAEEQSEGNGPCGVCKDCLRGQVSTLTRKRDEDAAELERLRRAYTFKPGQVTRLEAAEGRVAALEAALRRIADPTKETVRLSEWQDGVKPGAKLPYEIAREALAGVPVGEAEGTSAYGASSDTAPGEARCICGEEDATRDPRHLPGRVIVPTAIGCPVHDPAGEKPGTDMGLRPTHRKEQT
jgi:hypothetical protein